MKIIDQLPPEVLGALFEHATAEAPRECCGLLIYSDDLDGWHYLPARNLAPAEDQRDAFVLDPDAWTSADYCGEVRAIVHSHPNASANPSQADRRRCEESGLPWIIVGWPSQHLVELAPSGWQAPLVGREFAFGILDCYTLVQDFYARELHVQLPDFERRDQFWRRGEHLYRDGLAEAGFEVAAAAQPQVGDGLLMRIDSREVDNHAAVYLGDGLMLHHLYGMPSRLEVWDEPWQRRTTAIVRHRSFAAAAPVLRTGLLAELRGW